MPDLNICILWDSITRGAFDLSKWWWADRLKMKFMKNMEKNWIEIYNLGISGKTSQNILDRFEIETRSRDCDIAIIAIWINDSCFIWETSNNRIPKEIFQNNLLQIYKLSLKLNIKKLIFIWLTNVDEKLVNPYSLSSKWKCLKNEIILEYNEIIKNLCKENWLDFIQIYNELDLTDLSDWLHPNDVWHQKIADKVYNHLINII